MPCEEMKYQEFVAKMNTYKWKIGVGVTLGENKKEWIPNVKTWKCNSFEKLLKKLNEISRTWKFNVGDLAIYYTIPTGSKYIHVRDLGDNLEFEFEMWDFRNKQNTIPLNIVPNADLCLALKDYYKRCYFGFQPPLGLTYIKIKQLK
tara:strand:- start:1976 stop:2416 length:441 start_codon:yes stop_codon:yes gene_type:complete